MESVDASAVIVSGDAHPPRYRNAGPNPINVDPFIFVDLVDTS